MSEKNSASQMRRLRLPEIAERVNDIMQTRKGRQDALSVIGTSSETLMTKIKEWIDKETASLRQQLDLLEMARWDVSSERKELEAIERKFDETLALLETAKEQTFSDEKEISEWVEKYITDYGNYIRHMMSLGIFIDKIDKRCKDLLTYRDSLVDLLTDFRTQTSS